MTLRSPAQAEAAAAKMVSRLFAQAAETNVVGAFPTKELSWLQTAGLFTAALPVAMGGAGLQSRAATLSLLRALQHIGQGNLAVGRIYEGHLKVLMLIQQFGSAAQMQRYAADAQAGMLCGVWNTEDPAMGCAWRPCLTAGTGRISQPAIRLYCGFGSRLLLVGARLGPGGPTAYGCAPTRDRLLLVHWTPLVHDYPLTGDYVHEYFLAQAGKNSSFRHLKAQRHETYRLDLLEKR